MNVSHSPTSHTILLLFGGESPEHEVSLMSANTIYRAIKEEVSYVTVLCYVDPRGIWRQVDTVRKATEADPEVHLAPGAPSITIDGHTHAIDVLFPVLHGQNGEDGTIQGLARLLHIPIVGCGVAASAICLDKVMTKELLQAANIPTVPYMMADNATTYDEVCQKLSEQVFVKPARLGSSIGVSRVSSDAEWKQALQSALSHDTKVLVEPALTVRELEIAVLGKNDNPSVSGVGEILPDGSFYSFDSKYDTASQSALIIPADIDDALARLVQDLASKAFTVLGCRGLARIDFFLDTNGDVFLNEVNTMPGFTDISMYPRLWQEAGVTTPQLVARLIDLAT